jgi:hypothetical protein
VEVDLELSEGRLMPMENLTEQTSDKRVHARKHLSIFESVGLLLMLCCSVVLILASARLPETYYSLLRLIVFATCGLTGYFRYRRRNAFDGGTLVTLVMCGVFNPFWVLPLSRSTWILADVVCSISAAILVRNTIWTYIKQ